MDSQKLDIQIPTNLEYSVPIGISNSQFNNELVLPQSGNSSVIKVVCGQGSAGQEQMQISNANPISCAQQIYIINSELGRSIAIGSVSDEMDQPMKGSRSFRYTQLDALQEVNGIAPPPDSYTSLLEKNQFEELDNMIPSSDQQGTKDILGSAIAAINEPISLDLLAEENDGNPINLPDLGIESIDLQAFLRQEAHGQFEEALLEHHMHSPVSVHNAGDVTPSTTILQPPLKYKRSGKSNAKSEEVENADEITQPPTKKLCKYQIPTPLVDKNEEKKRKDSQRAKRNRDRQKENRDTLQQENASLKEKNMAMMNIIQNRYAPYNGTIKNQAHQIPMIFIPCPTSDTSVLLPSIAEQLQSFQQLPFFNMQQD